MHELAQRLSLLDPAMAETARVVVYFDTLVAGRASADALIQGAALLSGTAAGFVSGSTGMRVDATGARTDGPVEIDPTWLVADIPDVGRAWVEHAGDVGVRDTMIVERLAMALATTLGAPAVTVESRSALEILLDPRSMPDERVAAAKRLRTAPVGRMIARPAAEGPPVGVLVPTRIGFLHAAYSAGDRVPEDLSGPVGVGPAVPSAELAESWRSAVLALRLTAPRTPVVVADDLGALLPLLEVAADAAPHPDVTTIEQIVGSDPSALPVLEALSGTKSVRAAAAVLGLHHSSVRSRAETLERALGYPLHRLDGQLRLTIALRIHRMTTARFDA